MSALSCRDFISFLSLPPYPPLPPECAVPKEESSASASVSEEEERRSCRVGETFEERLAVCASGPDSLTREGFECGYELSGGGPWGGIAY